MFSLRPVTLTELDTAYAFVEEARAFQRAQGFVQWADNNPNRDTVQNDILQGEGFFFCEDNTPLGYLFLGMQGEPVYQELEGKWACTLPYLTMHRVAFGSGAQGKGLSAALFALAREHARKHGMHAIRIDTHHDNARMQHILAREGFVCRGLVHYYGGTAERMAYELVL